MERLENHGHACIVKVAPFIDIELLHSSLSEQGASGLRTVCPPSPAELQGEQETRRRLVWIKNRMHGTGAEEQENGGGPIMLSCSPLKSQTRVGETIDNSFIMSVAVGVKSVHFQATFRQMR